MSPKSLAQDLIEVERCGWEALCSDDAVTYYRQRLTEDALMAFPFGLMDRDEALSAMEAAQPWSRYDMKEPRVVPLGPDCGVVVYAVTAQREGQDPFSAVVSSTFVRRDGDWRLAFHQQSFERRADSQACPYIGSGGVPCAAVRINEIRRRAECSYQRDAMPKSVFKTVGGGP